MKRFKIYLFMTVIALPALFSSCGKDKSTADDNKIKTAKFTFTVTGAANGSVVSISASGNNTAGKTAIWKVNGQIRSGEDAIVLNAANFTGNTKTYVLEITEPLFKIGINLAGELAESGTPFKISYRAEVNGNTVKDEQSVTVDQTHGYLRMYTYNE
ncbi:hypothetical protein [Niabella beijingensis]|uniref:hypothetical protein n=1 Tax=Niabella beijingensis TaxID=2872700 RepID=UPI001CC03BFC|nr:hypothetical protein [Niabella beijingensis]MBZ4189404.1 hypothetical protein [Niabella beijingensis]